MKYIVGLFITLAALFVVAVGVIFGFRIYYSFEYGWNEETPVNYHRYSQYEVEGSFGVNHFRSGLANGFHLTPEEASGSPIVIFGNRQGDINYDLATTLAEDGYEVYALFYFGGDNLPGTIDRVPLEFFQDFLDVHDLADDSLTVIGTGKGAELALLLTNFYNGIDHLVLYSPSTHVFSGWDLNLEPHSSWTYEDSEVPYVNLRSDDYVTVGRTLLNRAILRPTELRPLYESALEDTDSEAARIPSSNFDGRALVFAGDDDQYWPSDAFSRELGMTMDNAEVIVFSNAGHHFNGPVMENGINYGGTADGNSEAYEESLERLLDFLQNR